MPKLKHIALSTQDVEGTARFYVEVFGDINLAILNFKNDAAAGVERGRGFSGIHHIGFQVDSLEAIADKLAAAGSERRDDVNQALGVGGRQAHGNVEVKYAGPDAIMLDVSETGWLGTPSFGGSA